MYYGGRVVIKNGKSGNYNEKGVNNSSETIWGECL